MQAHVSVCVRAVPVLEERATTHPPTPHESPVRDPQLSNHVSGEGGRAGQGRHPGAGFRRGLRVRGGRRRLNTVRSFSWVGSVQGRVRCRVGSGPGQLRRPPTAGPGARCRCCGQLFCLQGCAWLYGPDGLKRDSKPTKSPRPHGGPWSWQRRHELRAARACPESPRPNHTQIYKTTRASAGRGASARTRASCMSRRGAAAHTGTA